MSDQLREAVSELWSGEQAGKDAGRLTDQERAALDVVLDFVRLRFDADLPKPSTADELRAWAEDIENQCFSLAALPMVLRERAAEVEAQS